ncbi:AraC family transcriptional regulator [Microlunatus elymi]|uniref:AraC family transcriptional regulator n=1 Tax=Microlunatus elymi TaxID=2596828 RepID=A0A516PXP2_9ACTN|nr:AraC family transcriptional regulator [Microlunatus elymi]QDP95945.1 AraC family transcriptional regulator [Microlunatus elymi]
MDALSSLLNGPRARGAFLLRSMMSGPWSMRIEDEAPLTVVVLLTGSAFLTPERGEPARLEPGDAVVALGPDPYLVADRPDRSPQVKILPGQRCVTLEGEDLADQLSQGIRSWGNSADPETIMITGTYTSAGEVSRRLLDALPQLVVLPRTQTPSPIVDVLSAEMIKERPGQEVVLDRLLDLLLIDILRSWFTAQHDHAPGWYRATDDPQLGPVLGLIHDHPAEPWTVPGLAAAAGMSRAALARRFTALVGESPMSYLSGWRLALAADLLQESDRTLESIAREVGYGSAFALSTAFKRHHGLSPRDYRTQAA